MTINLRLFVLLGIILIVTGGLAPFLRPRQPRESGLQRFVNAATARAVVFIVVGVLAVLVGLGVVPVLNMEGDSARTSAPR